MGVLGGRALITTRIADALLSCLFLAGKPLPRKNLFSRPVGQNTRLPYDHNAITNGQDVATVRTDQHRTFTPTLRQLLHQVHFQCGIESIGRLIKQKKRGVIQESAREGDKLTLAA